MFEPHRNPMREQGTLKRASFSKKLHYGFAVVQNWNWATGEVIKSLIRVDAKHSIDRGQEGVWFQGSSDGMFGFAVRRADDLAALDTSAGEHRADRVAPWSRPGIGIPGWPLLSFGVRPNSPITTNSTSSSIPRSSKSSNSAATA